MFAAASRTRASSTRTTATSAARTRSRATRRSAPGRAASRGRCAASPSSSSSSTTLADEELEPFGGRADIVAMMRKAAEATCDFYIENTPPDGIPYWDTGAPGLGEARRLARHAGRSVQRL